jgi:cell division septum initiation protein DivIVA
VSDSDLPFDSPVAWRDPQTGEVNVELVLDQLMAVVENAKSMPLSSSAIVSREELIELIDAARSAMPHELARARRMLQDHEELLQRADYEAAQLIEAARAQAAHLVSRTEVARHARSEVERVLLDADAEARRIRHEAEDYVDRKLASFEVVLDRTIRTVQAGRERLAGVPAAAAPELATTEQADGEGEFSPFDQDQ